MVMDFDNIGRNELIGRILLAGELILLIFPRELHMRENSEKLSEHSEAEKSPTSGDWWDLIASHQFCNYIAVYVLSLSLIAVLKLSSQLAANLNVEFNRKLS